jgi:hypothetical protein
MNVIWSFELGQIWATCDDGRRIQTWTAPPSLGCLVDQQNASPGLSALLLPAWLGDDWLATTPAKISQIE